MRYYADRKRWLSYLQVEIIRCNASSLLGWTPSPQPSTVTMPTHPHTTGAGQPTTTIKRWTTKDTEKAWEEEHGLSSPNITSVRRFYEIESNNEFLRWCIIRKDRAALKYTSNKSRRYHLTGKIGEKCANLHHQTRKNLKRKRVARQEAEKKNRVLG